MSELKVVVSNEIFVPAAAVTGELEELFKRELTFANPRLGELIRMGYSIWRVPRKIICYRKLKSGYFLPLGFGPRLRQYCQNSGQTLVLDDRRVELPVTGLQHSIKLRAEQEVALEKILLPHRCILEAKPGFGKTMVGIAAVCARGQKTLIIVHTRALLEQWQKRFVSVTDLQPGDLGVIGEGKWQIGAKVTLAMYQTLLSRGIKDIAREFGLVVVDECHHVPANTFAKIVRGLAAKYCLGLTATPFRKDKLDRLLNFYLGKIIPTGVLEQSGDENLLPASKIPTTVFFRSTPLLIPDWEDLEFVELGTKLSVDRARQELIVADIKRALALGGRVIVLSERVGLAESLFAALAEAVPQVPKILITGKQKKQEREELFGQLKKDEFQLLVATGGVVGEGFDWPAANYLFLTFPFSWKGKLIQYVGRIQRVAPGKTAAFVYDYVDESMSIFRSMQRKRLAGYRSLGAQIGLGAAQEIN